MSRLSPSRELRIVLRAVRFQRRRTLTPLTERLPRPRHTATDRAPQFLEKAKPRT